MLDTMVLTFDPQDQRQAKLAGEIAERRLLVYQSCVGGMGQAELRIGHEDYVVGDEKIRRRLNDRLELSPAL
jgi:hypothetical protein